MEIWPIRALWAVAVIHVLVALIATGPAWLDMVDDGMVGAAYDGGALAVAEREFAVYFLACGVGLFGIAAVAGEVVRATGRLPRSFALWLTVAGVLLCVTEFAATGAWALLAIGLWAWVVAYRNTAEKGATT